MPAPEVTSRYQKVVLWAKTGVDRYTNTLRGDPVQLTVRWRYTNRDAMDPQGNKIQINATVDTEQDIPMNSLLWLGTLPEWNSSGSAATDTGLMEVVSFDNTPDVKNRVVKRTFGLKRYKNTLPESG